MKEDHEKQFPQDFDQPFPPAKPRQSSFDLDAYIEDDDWLDLDFLDANKVNSGTPYRPSTKSWED